LNVLLHNVHGQCDHKVSTTAATVIGVATAAAFTAAASIYQYIYLFVCS